jgi:ribokinase
MAKVYVVGSINQDIVVTADRTPGGGETVFGNDLLYFPGGKGANQAVAAHRLGATVLFRGKVGSDPFGDALCANFDKERLPYLVSRATKATGTAIIFVVPSGENSITVISGANADLQAEECLPLNFDAGDILVLQNEIPLVTNRRLLMEAKRIGMITIFSPAPAINVDDDFRAAVDWVVTNEHEFGVFFGEDLPQDLDRRVLKEMIRAKAETSGIGIVLTIGSLGVIAASGSEIVDVLGHKVEAVDTTGAGDCFVGALAARLASGDSILKALEYSNLAASISVTKMGACSSFPIHSEVALRLGETGGKKE